MNTTFEALVQEAAEVNRQLAALSTLAAHKLSPEAFQREAIAAARSTPARLAKLRQQLVSAGGALDHSNAALRRMVKAVRSPNITAPPREMRRLNYLLTDTAMAELAALGSGPFELFALAVLEAAETHPEDFGQAESFGAVERRLRDLTARRDELLARISKEFRPDDLRFGQKAGEVTFAMSDGAVPLWPIESAGERLVNWMLAKSA